MSDSGGDEVPTRDARGRLRLPVVVAHDRRDVDAFRALGLLARRPLPSGSGRPETGLGWTARELLQAPRAPRTRAGCAALLRPCPCLRCPHHLGVAAARDGGDSCTLDAAERGPSSMRAIARRLGLTRWGASVVLSKVLRQLRRTHPALAAELIAAFGESRRAAQRAPTGD